MKERRGAATRDRSPGPVLLLSLVPFLVSACLPDLPTRVALEDASDPRIRLSTPVVWVSSPEEGGSIQRAELYSEKGAPVFFEGAFRPGQELHLLAARIETPDLGFHILRIPVTDTVSPGPAFVQSSPAMLVNTYKIRLKLRLRDVDGSVVSIDSVNVNLR